LSNYSKKPTDQTPAERLREIEAEQFKRKLSETNWRLETETNANRFSSFPSISWRLPASTVISNN